jgi:hypothetical protein
LPEPFVAMAKGPARPGAAVDDEENVMHIPHQVLMTIHEDRLRTAARDQRVAALRREQADRLSREVGSGARPPRGALRRRVTRAFWHRTAAGASA